MPQKNTQPPFECIALLLQGGGALGAYQGGVYEALYEAGLEPNWLAGVSVGAINAAIIAGNAPKKRVEKLRQFWESVTVDNFQFALPVAQELVAGNETEHKTFSENSALRGLMFGVHGFFQPRVVLPWLKPKKTAALSLYDTGPLRSTLENLVDCDRINNGDIYFRLGATEVENGTFTIFDNEKDDICIDHIMASGALPPGLPPVKVNDKYYWDGGVVSNTPLLWAFTDAEFQDSLIFQVDLWSSGGNLPRNLAEVMTRFKDIQYSSRTSANTERFLEHHHLRHAIANLLDKLPEKLKNLPETKTLREAANSKVYNIVHLNYRTEKYEGYSKDFDFSRLNMEEHWKNGYQDTIRMLKNKAVTQRPHNKEGVAIFDLHRDKKSA